MAKKTDTKQTDTVRLNLEIVLTEDQTKILAGMMEGAGLNDTQKIRDFAEQLLTQQAAGGVMLTEPEVRLIEESTGVEFTTADQLIPYLSEKSGMQDGMHRCVVLIDPANYPAYEELARTQERPVDALVQEVVDMVQENEWVYELHPRPRQVLMTEADAEQIEELLSGKFSTGSELAQLILESLAGVSSEEDTIENLFEDDPQKVGA